MFDLLSHLFGAVCGQNPEHTWSPGGILLPCCQRCLGLYAGAGLAFALQLGLRPPATSRFLRIHGAFLLLMIPFGFHWLPQEAVLRTLTGALFGFGLVAFLSLPSRWSYCPRAGALRVHRPRTVRVRFYYAGLIAALALLPILAGGGGRLAAFILAALTCIGALALALLVLADLALFTAGNE